MRSEDAALFFEKCLCEEGLDDVEVAHTTNPETLVEEFYVRKPIGDEQLCYKTTITPERQELTTDVSAKKLLALEAEQVAQKFRQEMVDSFEWDGRRVEVSMFDGGWAMCKSCDTKVKLPRTPDISFSEDAEFTTPNPLPRDTERTVANLDDESELLLKLYLIGRLRERCDRDCRNHKYNRMQKPPAMIRAIAGD